MTDDVDATPAQPDEPEPASPSLFSEPTAESRAAKTRRPVAQRPAAKRPAARPDSPARRRAAAAAAPRTERAPRELPRWFWLLGTAELTFIVIVVVDAVSGWGDPPPGCFTGVCSLGQGVGLISLIAAIVFGIALVVAFFVVAARAAQQPRGTRRA